MLALFAAELVATFFFVAIILATAAPFPIAVALLGAIYLSSNISGGHVNPAVSVAMWAKGDLTASKLVVYVTAQLIGGLVALLWFKATNKPQRR